MKEIKEIPMEDLGKISEKLKAFFPQSHDYEYPNSRIREVGFKVITFENHEHIIILKRIGVDEAFDDLKFIANNVKKFTTPFTSKFVHLAVCLYNKSDKLLSVNVIIDFRLVIQ